MKRSNGLLAAALLGAIALPAAASAEVSPLGSFFGAAAAEAALEAAAPRGEQLAQAQYWPQQGQRQQPRGWRSNDDDDDRGRRSGGRSISRDDDDDDRGGRRGGGGRGSNNNDDDD